MGSKPWTTPVDLIHFPPPSRPFQMNFHLPKLADLTANDAIYVAYSKFASSYSFTCINGVHVELYACTPEFMQKIMHTLSYFQINKV